MMAIAIAAFTFTACEDVPEPYNNPYDQLKNTEPEVVVEPIGSGTQSDPYNVAAAYAILDTLEADVNSDVVFVKGIIVAVSEISTQYGNATYTISDNGTENTTLQIYRGLGLGGAKFTTEDALKAGDEVIVTGKLVNFRGNTKQFAQGSSIYSLNGETTGGTSGGEAIGDGTLKNPFNAAAANKYASTLDADTESENDIYIKGKIIEITENNQFNTQYGNCTFYISDDGTDSSDKFYVYRTLYLGNVKYTEEYKDSILPKAGDEVIICGKVVNYKGNTPETVANKSYIYSLNGQTSNGGGGTTQPTNESTIDNPYNIAKALEIANALADNETTSESFYIKGKVTRKANTADEIGPNSTKKYKDMNYYISEDGDSTENKELYVYRGKFLDGADFTDYEQLQVGDEVVIYSQLQKYIDTKNNNAIVLEAKNSKIVKLNGEGGEGGNNPQPSDNGLGTLDGNVLTLTFSEAGLNNQEKPSSLTLTDGTTLTFASNGNSNGPAYYNTGTAMRIYPKNSIAINAGSKKIAAIEIKCDNYNGTLYNASGDIAVGETKMTIDGDNLKFNGPNASTATVTNVSETTGAASQLRMKTLVITYSE